MASHILQVSSSMFLHQQLRSLSKTLSLSAHPHRLRSLSSNCKMSTETESSSPLTHSITLPTQLAEPVQIVVAPGISDFQFRTAINSSLFKQWLKNLQTETGILANNAMSLKRVLLQGVDMFGERVGFLKFKADIVDKETGKKVPGIVFARGPAVAILILLESEGETYAVLTEQVRVPVGRLSLELPAGMLDDDKGDFVGTAAPNTNTYSTLIDGQCKAGNFERAYELMNIMNNEGFAPNICTYNAIIDGLCKKGRVHEAYKLLKKGFQHGLQADRITYTILISEHCKQADTKQALVFFNKMVKAGLQPDIHTYTTLIAAFCRQRRLKESEKFFEEAIMLGLVPTKETYTSMICGYCRDGNINLAVKYFHRMNDHGCTPDSITYGALISGLCKGSKLDEAHRLYDIMIDKGLSPCEVTRLTLAYEYCKIDDSATAMIILERLDKKLWSRTVNTLVRKLCSEGKVGIAALFFHRILDKDRNVDRVTLAAFMTACYESNNYALVSSLSDRISKGIG